MRVAALAAMNRSGSKSGTSAAIRTFIRAASKAVIGRTPGSALAQALPERVDADPDRGDGPDAGDDEPAGVGGAGVGGGKRRRTGPQPSQRRSRTAALCPPSPTEIDMAARRSTSRGELGTQSRSQSGSGVS